MAVLFEHKAAKVLYIEEHPSSVTMVYVSGGGTSRYTRNFPRNFRMRSNLDPELRKPHEIRAFSWGEVKMAIAKAGLVRLKGQRDRERKSL